MTPKQVFKYFGGKVDTASRLGLSYQAVKRWSDNNKIPHIKQLQIEALTEGKLKASKLPPLGEK